MKAKFYKILRHTVPVLSAVFVFVSAFAFPVGAVSTVSYLDLKPNVVVDGDNNLITVSIPSEYMRLQIRNGNNDILAYGDSSLVYPVTSSQIYRIDVFFFYDTHLDASGIPDGSVFSWTVEQAQGLALFVPSNFYGEYWTYDFSGDSVAYHDLGLVPNAVLNGSYSVSFNIDKTNSSSFMFGGFFSHSRPNSDGNAAFYIVDATIQFTISSFLASQEGSSQSNKLLNEVNRQLEEQGKKMDDFINGSPEQNESANNAAGVLGDKGEQLGNLAGDIQPNKPNLDSVSTNVSDIVPSTGVSFLTSAISPFANNELVVKLLVIVATLILVSYVLFGKRG